MNLEIIDKPLALDLYGFSGIAMGKDYAGTAFRLMGKIWPLIKTNSLKSKGLNIWVYELDEKVFAGVELESAPPPDTGLERKGIVLAKYGYYKHIGPYSLIQQSGRQMREELKAKGLEITMPYIEIYGHWTNDESKLETELFMALR